jgi:hypothetical protein
VASSSLGTLSWSKVSRKSEGVDTKRSGLFVVDTNVHYCLRLIGKVQLLVCGKPEIECNTTHQGGKLEMTKELSELVFIRDPQLAVQFLKEPVAEKAWFLEGTLRVMEKSKKTVTEWAEYFNAAQATADPDHISGADILDIEKQLKFVKQVQDFATPVKAAEVKADMALMYDSSPLPLVLNEIDIVPFGNSWKEESGLPEKVIEHLIELGEAIARTNEGLRKAQV